MSWARELPARVPIKVIVHLPEDRRGRRPFMALSRHGRDQPKFRFAHWLKIHVAVRTVPVERGLLPVSANISLFFV